MLTEETLRKLRNKSSFKDLGYFDILWNIVLSIGRERDILFLLFAPTKKEIEELHILFESEIQRVFQDYLIKSIRKPYNKLVLKNNSEIRMYSFESAKYGLCGVSADCIVLIDPKTMSEDFLFERILPMLYVSKDVKLILCEKSK